MLNGLISSSDGWLNPESACFGHFSKAFKRVGKLNLIFRFGDDAGHSRLALAVPGAGPSDRMNNRHVAWVGTGQLCCQTASFTKCRVVCGFARRFRKAPMQ